MAVNGTSVEASQPPASVAGRQQRLVVAWQDPQRRAIQPVGFLTHDELGYEFYYIRNVVELPTFSPFIGFPDLWRRYRSSRLFPLFSQRVMDPRRPDYKRFVSALHLAPTATPWEQLARSEGRRAGDTILLAPEPLITEDGFTRCNFLVHGIRHILREDPGVEQRLLRLNRGDHLTLVNNSDNPVNGRAVYTADADEVPLGWVPDLLLDYVHAVRHSGAFDLNVSQANGPDAPVHLRLLVSLSGRVPDGFTPFSDAKWEPLD